MTFKFNGHLIFFVISIILYIIFNIAFSVDCVEKTYLPEEEIMLELGYILGFILTYSIICVLFYAVDIINIKDNITIAINISLIICIRDINFIPLLEPGFDFKSLLNIGFIPLWSLPIILLILTEFFYWFFGSNKKLKKGSVWLWFILKEKLIAVFKSIITISISILSYNVFKKLNWNLIISFTIKWIGIIGFSLLIIIGIVLIIIFYLWLNSFKYRRKLK